MLAQCGVAVHVVRLFRKEDHGDQRQQHGNGRDAIDALPAEALRQRRRNQHRHGGADIAGPDQAHGQAFVTRRERAGAQAERHTKTGAGDAQQHAHGQQAAVGINKEITEQQGHHDQPHLDQGGVFAADVLGQHAERKTHERAGKNRYRQHHAFLGGREVVGF